MALRNDTSPAKAPAATDELLAPGLLRKLERLSIRSRRLYPGASSGERVTAARGSGMEFADYKEYSRGDDFRAIDWKVYARLDQFVVKTFETEENLPVTVLLDCSASMDFGAPERSSKWRLASRLAAALGYVAMVNGDQLALYAFSARLHEKLATGRGRGGTRGLLDYIASAAPNGTSDFTLALREAGRRQRPGVCIIVSDFCSNSDLGEGLKGLAFNGHEVTAMHVWDPLEADPGLEGEVDVEDAETGEVLSLTVKGDTVQQYREAFEKRCRGIAAACARYDANYLRISTEEQLEQVLIHRLRRENVVR